MMKSVHTLAPGAAPASYESTQQSVSTPESPEDLYQAVRDGFERFMGRIEQFHFLSQSERHSQRQWISSIRGDQDKVREAYEAYVVLGEQAVAKNAAEFAGYRSDLRTALENGYISRRSHDEWIAWLQDEGRDSSEKKASIRLTLPKYLAKRKGLQAKLRNVLDDALQHKHIPQETYDEWMKKLINPDVAVEEKESFITSKLPAFKAEWEKVGSQRKTLLENPLSKTLKGKNIPHYEAFLSDNAFQKLRFRDRKPLVEAVEKAVKSLKNNKEEAEKDPSLEQRAKAMLEEARQSGAMHENRIRPWLQSLFEKKRSNEEITRILNNTLPEYIRKWKRVRLNYDIAEKKLEENRVPEGTFTRLSPAAFLQKELPEREAYVQKAKQAVLDYRRERDGAFFDLQLLIDQEDFEEAKKEADRLGKTPLSTKETWKLEQAKFEIRMGQIDDARQSQSAERKQGDEAPLQEARAAYDELHNLNPAAARMAHMAAGMSVGAVNSFKNGVYNVIWCMQRKIPIFNDFAAAEAQAREQSAERAEHNLSHGQGHTLTYKGSKDEMDRFENGKWSSDVVFVSQDTEDQKDVIQTCEEQKNNHAANYWRSIVVPNLDRDQYPAVLSALYKLRGAMQRSGGKPVNILDIKRPSSGTSSSLSTAA